MACRHRGVLRPRVPRSGSGAATAGMLGFAGDAVKYLSTRGTEAGEGRARAARRPGDLDRQRAATPSPRARADPGRGGGSAVQGLALRRRARPGAAVDPSPGPVPDSPGNTPRDVLRPRQPGHDGGVLSRP
jgi:hypothetical protein